MAVLKTSAPLEIERKFLIAYPDVAQLSALDGCRVREITQTYLLCDSGTLRVRKTVCGGKTTYHVTQKRRISALARVEDEKEISGETYTELLRCADGTRTPIVKTRYAFPAGKHTAEVDIFPFWRDRAILEIELQSEDEPYEIPPFLSVIKEVTGDRRYTNASLAKRIVTETL